MSGPVHEFQRVNFANLLASRWRCVNCGLKASDRAARQLEGMACR